MKLDFGLPFVAAIIEREQNGVRQVLVQSRIDSFNQLYNGVIEFAAGSLDKLYESVYDAIAREILEETGMTLKNIIDDSRTEVVSPQIVDGAFGFRPFCCLQQVRAGTPWVGFVFRCEVEDGTPMPQEGETKDVRWIDAAQLKQMINEAPEQFFTLELPAWEYYFKEVTV